MKHASALVPLLLSSALLLHETCGQEAPTLFANMSDPSVSFRTNVCERYLLFHRGDLALREALRGLSLNPVIGNWGSEYFHLDSESGAIDEKDPGVVVKIMDELASRAGFTWRNSYGVYYGPEEGQTWTDVLLWTARAYDFVADYWFVSTERLNLGFVYLPGWYDASYIMVGQEKVTSKVNLLSWTEPFHWKVWVMILITCFLTGVIHKAMEFLKACDRDFPFTNPTNHFFLPALALTGHFEFEPESTATKLYTFSLGFWSLVLLAAYTANLANFFVVKNVATLGINAIDDAVVQGMPICVWQDSATEEYITKRFPSYKNFVRIADEKEVIMATAGPDRRCQVGITTVSAWDSWVHQKDVNVNCELSWIGRAIKFGEASFMFTGDSGILCTSFIRDVLTLHMEEMKAQEFIDRLLEEHLRKVNNQDCASLTTADTGNDDQITLPEIAGVFITHYLITTLAVIVAVISLLRKRRKGLEEIPTSEESIHDTVSDPETKILPPGTSGDVQSEEGTNLIAQEQNEEVDHDLFQGNKFLHDLFRGIKFLPPDIAKRVLINYNAIHGDQPPLPAKPWKKHPSQYLPVRQNSQSDDIPNPGVASISRDLDTTDMNSCPDSPSAHDVGSDEGTEIIAMPDLPVQAREDWQENEESALILHKK